jgi:urease accessory protein
MKTSFQKTILFSVICCALPSLALAHPGHGIGTGFVHGFHHPFSGWDHLLAMIAVGLWAVQLGGRAIWAVPCSFVGTMILGYLFGMSGHEFSGLEQGISFSVLAFGLVIAFAARWKLPTCMPLVGTFAFLHGYAHGLEVPVSASGLTYTLGFVLATSTLHLIGMALGFLLNKCSTIPLLRIAGVAVCLLGATFWLLGVAI